MANITGDISFSNETSIQPDRIPNHYETSKSALSNFRRATFYCALLMLCLCIIGSIGNIMSFWVFTRRSMRSSPINVLLAALSAIDFSVLTSAVAVFVIPNFNTFLYHIPHRILYRIIINGFYQASMIAQTCSVWMFVLISLERYVAVCDPMNARRRLTVRKARLAFTLVLLLACLYNLPRFFEYRSDQRKGYVPLLRDSYYYFAIYFTSLYLVTHFLAPFLTITILNVIIFKTICRAKNEREYLSSSRNSKKSRKKYQTTRMITLVTIIFGLCNILPFVLNIWEALDDGLFHGPKRMVAYLTLDISNVLVVLNSATTFIVYFAYCQKYRSILISRLFPPQSSSSSGYSSESPTNRGGLAGTSGAEKMEMQRRVGRTSTCAGDSRINSDWMDQETFLPAPALVHHRSF